MVTPELLTYIRKQITDNYSESAIADILAKYGWKQSDILYGMDMAKKGLATKKTLDRSAGPEVQVQAVFPYGADGLASREKRKDSFVTGKIIARQTDDEYADSPQAGAISRLRTTADAPSNLPAGEDEKDPWKVVASMRKIKSEAGAIHAEAREKSNTDEYREPIVNDKETIIRPVLSKTPFKNPILDSQAAPRPILKEEINKEITNASQDKEDKKIKRTDALSLNKNENTETKETPQTIVIDAKSPALLSRIYSSSPFWGMKQAKIDMQSVAKKLPQNTLDQIEKSIVEKETAPIAKPIPPIAPAKPVIQSLPQLPISQVNSPKPQEQSAPVQSSVRRTSFALPTKKMAPISIASHFRPIRFALLALAIVVVLGGGILAYSYFASPSPEKALAKMLSAISSGAVKSAEWNGTIIIHEKSPTDLKKELPANITISGAYESLVPDDVKSSTTLSLDSDFLKGMLELKREKQGIYFKLSGLSAKGEIFDTIVKIQNTWYRVEQKSFGSVLDEFGFLPLHFKSIDAKLITSDEYQKIRGILFSANNIKITSALPDELINGILSRHYAYEVNTSALIQAIRDISKLLGADRMSAGDLSMIIESIKRYAKPAGQIWIGKKDFLPYRLTLSLAGNASDNASYNNVVIPQTSVDISVSLLSVNKVVQITEPSPYRSIDEFLSGNRAHAKDVSIENALSSGETEAKTYFKDKKKYTGVCADQAGLLPLVGRVNQISATARPLCNDNTKAYAIGASLSDGSYYCVDSTGFAGRTAVQISSAHCPPPAPENAPAPADSALSIKNVPAPDSSSLSADKAIKSILAKFYSQAKTYFARVHGYKYSCTTTKEDGFSSLLKELRASGSSVDPACKDAISGWAVSAKLSGAGAYWCVDSAGHNMQTTSPAITTVCQ